jgi:hypothetical protein
MAGLTISVFGTMSQQFAKMQINSVSILASFCVWTKSLKCKDAVNRDSTISESASQKKFKFPVSRPDDRAIPSGR